MTNKNILIIGGLSRDEIHLTDEAPPVGGIAIANTRHVELGGRGANTAVAAYRSYNPKPDTLHGYVDQSYESQRDREDPERPSVHIIGACVSEEGKHGFVDRMAKNGVKHSGIEVLSRLEDDDQPNKPLSQDFLFSMMDGRTGQTLQSGGFDASSQWSTAHFSDIDSICHGYRPQLVIVTMELKKRIVEHIIDIVHEAGIEVLLYASPGETLALACYPKLTHLICNQFDAAKMLGWNPEEINADTWAEVCSSFTKRGVKNVVVKVGPLGAFFKNESDEGYASAHRSIKQIIDQTGATATFVGTYAMEYLRLVRGDPSSWDIRGAVARANKACYFVVGGVGYDRTMAWSDEIDGLDQEPLFANIEELTSAPARKKKFKYLPGQEDKPDENTEKDPLADAFVRDARLNQQGSAQRELKA